MAAHRYWRLLLPPADIGNGTFLSQIELRESVGGVDVAAPATKSSNHSLVNIAAYFDGNNATSYYATSGYNAALSLYIDFDFDSTPRDIQEVMYRTANNSALSPYRVYLWYRDSLSDNWSFTSLNDSTYADAAINTNYTFSGFTELGNPAKLLSPVSRLTGDEPPAINWRLLTPILSPKDVYYGGRGRIAGTVKEDASPSDLPLRRRVRLLRDRDGHFIRETWSNATTGLYSFDNIDESERYTAIAYDHEHDYRAVIADNLQPELMP